MSRVAVLGLGAMGSRVAARLLEARHQVSVWNRTPERGEPLGKIGARVAPTPRDAAHDAEVAIAMVRDDEASRWTWTDAEVGALAGLSTGAVAIESSTLSLDWTRTLARLAAEAEVAFLDAPVAGSRPQADAGQLIYLVGGEAEVLQRVRPLLETLGGAIHHAGAAGAGAGVKLAVNALFGVQIAVVAEFLGMLRRVGLDPARAMEIIGATPVCSPAAKGAAGSMLAGAYAPMFPAELVEKDFAYVCGAAGGPGRAPVIAAAQQVFRAAIERGWGADNLTSVARLYE